MGSIGQNLIPRACIQPNTFRDLALFQRFLRICAGRTGQLLNLSTLADQLALDPQRGALFETWVVGELLKGRYNRALPSNLFFWLDNTGNEVDVIVDLGLKLLPIEIKSGQTINADYFSGLCKWLSWAGTEAGRAYLVYGGDESQQRNQGQVVPWREMTGLVEVL